MSTSWDPNTPTWDDHFMAMAVQASGKSKDASTKVGCVIVGEGDTRLVDGFNGFSRGVNERVNARWERPAKYSWVGHAERNAVYNAARHGIALLNSRAYVTCLPCNPCTDALIQAGVVEIIIPRGPISAKGIGTDFEFEIACTKRVEAGIRVRYPNSEEYL